MQKVCKTCGAISEQPAVNYNKPTKFCKLCEGTARVARNALKFKTKAIATHGATYDYTKSIYTGTKVKLIITCPIHGDFEQTPDAHYQGKGCAKCGHNRTTISKTSTLEAFITNANIRHNNKYSYSKVKYTMRKDAIIITCPTHGDFSQKPSDHLSGCGCRNCAVYGFDLEAPAILYFFKIGNIYKVGVTNNKVETRYIARDYIKFSNILTWECTTGQEAYDREQYLINYYKQYAYTGPTPFTDGTKTTECFTEDIYKLWEKENE